jgi:nucleoside-diphosphate-sugar epimerase
MRILITGKNSYIGNSVKEWLNQKEPSFMFDEMSLRNVELRTVSFKNFNNTFHIAGIAHLSSNKLLLTEYLRVNRDSAIEVAKKAKKEVLNHLFFASSMAIYGDDHTICDFSPININHANPFNPYGQSKLEVELVIQKLKDTWFKVSILKIYMVYGINYKGKFPKLEKMLKCHLFFKKTRIGEVSLT